MKIRMLTCPSNWEWPWESLCFSWTSLKCQPIELFMTLEKRNSAFPLRMFWNAFKSRRVMISYHIYWTVATRQTIINNNNDNNNNDNNNNYYYNNNNNHNLLLLRLLRAGLRVVPQWSYERQWEAHFSAQAQCFMTLVHLWVSMV